MKKLTYNKFGKRMGNLGNSLFQLATLHSFSLKYGRELELPEWNYQSYFKHKINLCERGDFKNDIVEDNFHYSPSYWDKVMRSFFDRDISISGWFQSWKYWQGVDIKKFYEWDESFISKIKVPDNGKRNLAVTIRIGDDYKQNGNYVILPINYYLLALEEQFPNWREYNLCIFSDNFDWCRVHFASAENAFFMEGSDIEQLAMLSLCDDFILANSTFSFWGAYLGEKEGSKVVRPKHYFQAELAKTHTTKDFWLPNWVEFDHLDEHGHTRKIDLKDVSFNIPVAYDHHDRTANFGLCICMLQRDFDTNIIVGEWGGDHFKGKVPNYYSFSGKVPFHRTYMLNELADISKTQIIVNYDCDNITPPLHILQAVDKIRKGKAQMVYPYTKVARVKREWFPKIEKDLDCGSFGSTVFPGMRDYDPVSVGHAIVWDKESFIYGGMENQNFISYGPEDVERKERFERLGTKIERINGTTYHMDHWVGPDSSGKNPFFGKNYEELAKIRALSDEHLREYVGSWPWVKAYTSQYYEGITDESVISGVEVFDTLVKTYDDKLFSISTNVIDVGCGMGAWSVGAKKNHFIYKGVDYKIPKFGSLLSKEEYAEYNIEGNEVFPFVTEHENTVVLCLEVAEHIKEEYSDKLVNLLCSLGSVVIFSAAIPNQGGLNHVNEQWQEYWWKKFHKNGYSVFKMREVRKLIRNNEKINLWYRNNLLIFTKDFSEDLDELNYVHPKFYENIVNHYKNGGK